MAIKLNLKPTFRGRQMPFGALHRIVTQNQLVRPAPAGGAVSFLQSSIHNQTAALLHRATVQSFGTASGWLYCDTAAYVCGVNLYGDLHFCCVCWFTIRWMLLLQASLLDPATSFPSSPFDSPELLAALQVLGLKSSITHQVLIQAASLVQSTAEHDPEGAAQRGRTLLRYLEVHSGKLLLLGNTQGALENVLFKVRTVWRSVTFNFRTAGMSGRWFWGKYQAEKLCCVVLDGPLGQTRVMSD